ncbi:hypothetical protein [Deinococcus multiflagellatus]|uniref:Uncharacterized protein n=1 Tax=Deinococcus multiflagellatus TaxID=1656887 RepID=A0ABW1ZFU4_9DEIO|nr:hypothetical protein [Deinococcus multiflagellatus]MBZ9712205.1 hypothetical protein [Deinococcus multiflagellatus]
MTDDFPSAAQARATLDQRSNLRAESELLQLRTKINHAIERGECEVRVSGLQPVTVHRLQGLGYRVQSRQAGPNESEVVVSW